MDIAQVKGLAYAKRAAEVALTGGHSILYTSVRGSGKSILLQAVGDIAEQVYGEKKPYTLYDTSNPFVRLEEEATLAAIIRVYNKDRIIFAGIPVCECGFYRDNLRRCACEPKRLYNYYEKLLPIGIEFPLYLHIERPSFEELIRESNYDTSDEWIKRIKKAHIVQEERYKDKKMMYPYNGYMRQEDILEICKFDEASRSILRTATNKLGLTARQFYNVLKIGRTIADMAESKEVLAVHLAEAIQYQYKPQVETDAHGNNIIF